MAGSYWNHIRWRGSTGGKLTKITLFFACWRRKVRGKQREERVKEEEGREEERNRDKVFSIVYKIYHSIRTGKHIYIFAKYSESR